MPEYTDPSANKTVGDLLRQSLSTLPVEERAQLNNRASALEYTSKLNRQRLRELALQKDKTLGEFSQDAAVALAQGIVNTGTTAASLMDLLTQPSEEQRILNEKLGIPQTKSLGELTGFQEAGDVLNEEIARRYQTDKGEYRTKNVEQALAVRETGKEQRVQDLVQDGIPESVATVVDEAGTIADTLMQYADNPTLIIDETIKSLPLMLAGGAGAKASQKLAAALKPGATTSGIGGAAAAIGATEGGSSAGSTKAEVLKMSEKDLFDNSDTYKTLRAEGGMNHEEARSYIADKAALRTFKIAAPIAAVAGKVTGAAKFEAELLGGAKDAVTSVVKKTAKNIASEATEEAIQGASSEVASNIAVKTLADEEQDISEGVGRSIGTGAIVGGAAGGALGAPRNLVDAAKVAVANPIVETKEDLEDISKAADEGIQVVTDRPVEDKNINVVLAAIQKRNASEDVTPEEHKQNVDAALNSIKENMEYVEGLQSEMDNLDPKTKEGQKLQKVLDTQHDRQAKAFEQYKLIQAREQSSVTSKDVEEAIEQGDAEDFIQSFRARPESVSKEDAETFYSKSPDITPEQKAIIDAHVNVEESIKDMDAVSNDILIGSPKDGFLGIRNYQIDINKALEEGNRDEAQASLKSLTTFSNRHADKAKLINDAFNGNLDAVQKVKEIYTNKKGKPLEIIPRDRNAKFSAGLVERVQKESDALAAAVIQAQLNIDPKTVTPKVTTDTSVEPEVTTEATDRTPGSDKATPEVIQPVVKEATREAEITTPDNIEKAKEFIDAAPLDALLRAYVRGDRSRDKMKLQVSAALNNPKAFGNTITVAESNALADAYLDTLTDVTPTSTPQAEIAVEKVLRAKREIKAINRTISETENITEKQTHALDKWQESLEEGEATLRSLEVSDEGRKGLRDKVLNKVKREEDARKLQIALSHGKKLRYYDSNGKALRKVNNGPFLEVLYDGIHYLVDTSDNTLVKSNKSLPYVDELIQEYTSKLTPQAEATQAKPEVAEAAPEISLQEKVLGTQQERTTLSDKGFTVRESAKKTALNAEPELMTQLDQDPNVANKYSKESLTEKDITAIKSMSAFYKNTKQKFDRLFRHNPLSADKDYLQYIADEQGNVDEGTKTAISMAAYEWMVANAGSTVYNSFDDINSMLGRKDKAYVPKELSDKLNTAGSLEASIVDSIGASAVRSLGIQADASMPANIKSNLEQSLGAMGLVMLQDAGYLKRTTYKAKELQATLPDKEQNINFGDFADVKFFRVPTVQVDGQEQIDGSVGQLLQDGKGSSNLLNSLFDIESKITGPTKVANKKVAEFMRKTFMKTPEAVKPIIKEHQSRAHYIAREKMDKFLGLDREVQLEILGYVKDPSKTEHAYNRKGVLAKNAAIVRELDYMVDANEEFGDNPMYFTHEMTVVNRLLLVSNTFNPQGSTVHRHFAYQHSWKSNINMGNRQQMREFFTAFGESMGIKTDTGTWKTYGPKIMDMVEDSNVIAAANAVYEGGNPEVFLPYIKEGAYSYDGLMNLGKYYAALNSGSNTFESDLFREVDGVTNGVIIGTLNLDAGIDETDKQTKLARGGIFTDGVTESFGEFKSNNDDSYEAISKGWKANFDYKVAGLKGEAKAKMVAAESIFGTIERGDSKGGLIQTVYGAGEASIREGVAKAFLDKFYKQVTKAALANDTITLKFLSENINTIVPGSIKLAKDPLEQVLSKKHTNQVIEYIEEVYGQPLVDAIDTSFGDFKEKGSQINQAMDIAYQAYMLMREAEVKKHTEEGIAEGTLTEQDDLSPIALDSIDNALKQAMPIMHSYFSQQSGNIEEGLFVGKYSNERTSDEAYVVEQRYLTQPLGSKTKQTKTRGKKRVMQSPGASPAVLGVQSIDAATMLKHLEKHNALNVYDAIIVGQMDAMQQAKYINKMFMDVQSNFSIMGSAYDAMVRSLDLLETYDPNLRKQINLKSETDLSTFIQEMNTTVQKVDQAKAKRLDNVTAVSQYHVDGGETVYTSTEPGSIPNTIVKEVRKEGVDFLGSTGPGIDPSTFQADEEITIDTVQEFQGPLQENVVRMTPTQVFDKLGNVGSVVESTSHSQELKSLLENVVTKVMDPVKLHMQANSQFETVGATNGLDMYIINQSVGYVPPENTNGIRMSSQEVYMHELVHNVTKEGINKSSALTRRLMRLWSAAKQEFTVEDFMSNPGLADTDPSYAKEYQAAKLRYEHIFHPTSKAKQFKYNPSTGLYDSSERADFLHEFMAFGITNERFRKKLAGISPNLGTEFKASTNLLDMLSQVFEAIMDLWHSLTVARGNADITAQQQLDNMFRAITHVQQRHKVKVFNDLEAAGKLLNAKMNSAITASRKAVSKIAKSKIFIESKQPIVRFTGRITGLVADDRAEFFVDQLKDLRDLHAEGKEGLLGAIVTELQGRTVDNGTFHDLNRVANMTVDQQRKHIKTLVAEISEKMYEGHPDGLNEEQKAAITKVLLKTDLSVLMNGRALEDVQQLISSPTKLEKEIDDITSQLQQFGNLTNFYVRSAASLGHFMATGKVTEGHSLMNASQISKLKGTGRATPTNAWLTRAEPLIDQLASLYALKYTDATHKTVFNEVMLSEMQNDAHRNGVSFSLHMAAALKEDAQRRLFAGHDGMVKGYIKEELNPHIAVEYGTLADEAEMNRMGFFRQPGAGPIPKEVGIDPNQSDIYMYVNRHGGMNRFAAGTASKTGKKHKGSNTFTNRIQGGDPQPGVTGMQDIQHVSNLKKAQIDNMFNSPILGSRNTEHLVPLLNNVGKVVGYRYTMSEEVKDNFLEKNNEFQDVLGSTAASIQDKVSSTEINTRIVDALKEQFDSDFGARANSFVEIGPNSSDPELREIYYMMPDEMRKYVKSVWGGDTIYVKRDQVNLIFGYRKFSVTDIWNTDPSDLNGFQRAFISAMDNVFSIWGGSAYSQLKLVEGAWQEIIKDIKDIIVIKTGIVTAVNTLSNTVSLRMLGVPMKDILRDQAEAFKGAVDYQKDMKEIRELEAILAADQRPGRRTLDQERLAILKNQIANNPVRELVESGVYQTIVEDVETTDGGFTYKTEFSEWVGDLTEPLVSKIPQGVKDVAKNVYMAHDSKLYKTFNQAAVLSDFTARYALHKHYTTRAQDPLSSKDAIAKVVSIFIDYDLPTHKGIQYMNDMGIMWFSKYNFRLQKILTETMKENPARVIGVLALQGVFGDLPDMYDNSVFTHDMTSMFRNPVNNLDVLGEIAPINLGTSAF